MRYVGRHRAQRPLLLRRPVVGGAVVAVAILGGVPAVLTLTGNGSAGHAGDNTKKVAGAVGVTQQPTDATDPTTVSLPTDDTVVDTSSPAATTSSSILTNNSPAAGRGVVITTHTTGGGAPTHTTKPPVSPTKKPTKTKPPTSPAGPTSAPPPTSPITPPTTEPPPTATSDVPPAAASVGPTEG